MHMHLYKYIVINKITTHPLNYHTPIKTLISSLTNPMRNSGVISATCYDDSVKNRKPKFKKSKKNQYFKKYLLNAKFFWK